MCQAFDKYRGGTKHFPPNLSLAYWSAFNRLVPHKALVEYPRALFKKYRELDRRFYLDFATKKNP